MKKIKKLAALLLVGALSLGIGAFAACGDDDTTTTPPADNSGNTDNGGNDNTDNGGNTDDSANANGYTLLVKDEEGNAMADYYITICIVENGEKTTCLEPKKTDANGEVVFEVTEGNYAVSDANAFDTLELAHDYYLTYYGSTLVVIVDTNN